MGQRQRLTRAEEMNSVGANDITAADHADADFIITPRAKLSLRSMHAGLSA